MRSTGNVKRKNPIAGIAISLLLIIAIALAGAAVLVKIKPGWHRLGNLASFYTTEDGKLAKGYRRIDDEPYYFSKYGTTVKKGWIGEDREYYCDGDGKLAVGWRYMDGKAYYFFQTEDSVLGHKLGARASSYTTQAGITIPDSGYLEGDEALAIGYALDVLNRYGNSLESAFKYSSSLRFVEGSDEHYGENVVGCAIHGFENGEGNCLAWAGTFVAMAKVLGYDARLVWGKLPFHDEMVPHGWVEIWEDDGIHVYDPRQNEGVDFSGFDKRYGEKGSRKYDEDSKEYFEWK